MDPRPFAVGSILKTYEKYPHIGNLLPAMGYSEQQIKELKTTINNSDAEMVLIATPIDLGRLLDLKTPAVRLKYELQEIGEPTLENVLAKLL